MKRGTPRHPKIDDLAARLGKPKYVAVGLLEMLWHFTAEFAHAGDIGRFTDEAIAKALCWDGASTILVSCLVDAGWLDRCKCHRLRVHDWPDHADQTVSRVLAKRNQAFLQCYDDPSTMLAQCYDETSQPSPSPSPSPIAKSLSPTPPPGPVARECPFKVEPPKGFPTTDTEASETAAFVGCTEDFARKVWTLADSRGWKDSRGVQIANWRAYLRLQWTYQQESDERAQDRNQTVRHSPGLPAGSISASVLAIQNGDELKRVLEEIKRVKDRASQDAMGNRTYSPTDKKRLTEMVARRDQLRQMMGVSV